VLRFHIVLVVAILIGHQIEMRGLLPSSYALQKLGYSDDQVTEIRAARRAEALDTAGVDLTRLVA
jgi:hypothetical protein